MSENILVIKLGALGDFIYALGPMAAIRKAHPQAHITLLTTAPYKTLGENCKYFNSVLIDSRPRLFDIAGWIKLYRTLNALRITRVYDLQNNDRSGLYFKLFRPRPAWVGAVKGASHRNDSPQRSTRHAFLGHRQTLSIGGIEDVTLDNLAWMKRNTGEFHLPQPYALLVAGCSPQHPEKRWPIENFRVLAAKLIRHGITPVLIGSKAEDEINAAIARGMDVCNLSGKTDLFDIPELAHGATCAIGNDTGPMHMAAVSGCPVVMLFSQIASKLELHAPPDYKTNPVIACIEAPDIGQISVRDVFAAYQRVCENIASSQTTNRISS